jgi:hypothetical protein
MLHSISTVDNHPSCPMSTHPGDDVACQQSIQHATSSPGWVLMGQLGWLSTVGNWGHLLVLVVFIVCQ